GPTTPPACRWCATAAPAWACPTCGHHGLRAPVRGNVRTAEELGRSFAGTTVRSSHAEHMVDSVPHEPAIVVATVGAEPVAERGYGTVVLLDTWLTLARDDLRVEEEALRRWMSAAGLAGEHGHVVAVGDPSYPSLQALVRWDPAGFASRQAAQRAQAHLPPAARVATLTGTPGALSDALTVLDLPSHADVLGPVPDGEEERVILRVPPADGTALVSALGELQRVRAARKLEPVRVQVDPATL
ncbi:MAG: primosome assembly protein PriA, partial [Nocardioides sp.]